MIDFSTDLPGNGWPSAWRTADPAEVPVRAGLVATQTLGFALTRYVLCLPPVVALDRDAVVTWLGPTLQRYLTG